MDLLHANPAPPVWPLTIIALVALERVLELMVSRRHEKALLARGAVEVGAGHYPAIVAVHTLWLLALGAWAVAAPAVNLPLLVLFLAVQPLRFWVIATLGRYWTTRIITLPDAPLVRRGPYRFVKHPNYAVVVLEIALLPLALGAWPLALLFTVMNALVMAVRIKVENEALRRRA